MEVQGVKQPTIVKTDFGYQYFERKTDRVLLYEPRTICIEPNPKQKKPPIWEELKSKGAATRKFNRMYREFVANCVLESV